MKKTTRCYTEKYITLNPFILLCIAIAKTNKLKLNKSEISNIQTAMFPFVWDGKYCYCKVKKVYSLVHKFTKGIYICPPTLYILKVLALWLIGNIHITYIHSYDKYDS